MSEEVELMDKCLHDDCVYRGYIYLDGQEPVCQYALVECKARGCKISECDKYRAGKKIRARLRREDIVIYWERELYGDETNSVLGH